MSEINDRIAALEAQLAELKVQVSANEEAAEPTSRRDVFKKLAIGAAGVAAGGALLGKATPAMANDPDDITLGASKSTAGFTRADYTGANTGVGFLFQSGSNFTNTGANPSYRAPLAGWASANGNLANGVYGFTEAPNGYGVVGFGGVGIAGSVGGHFRGQRAAINVFGNGTASDALVAAVKAGDILATTDGTLWFAPADGKVVPLGGAGAGNALYILDAPVRCYDSRESGAGGLLNAAGSPRTVALKKGKVGATPNVDAVPAGAIGALISLTLDATTGAGFIGAFAADLATWPGNSNANWYTTGQILAVTTVSKVDADAQIKLQVGGGGSTQVIVDVIGYYA